jgi:hypothetical protein
MFEELDKIDFTPVFKELQDMDAGMTMKVVRDMEGNPLSAIIVVDGTEECRDILNAVNSAAEEW